MDHDWALGLQTAPDRLEEQASKFLVVLGGVPLLRELRHRRTPVPSSFDSTFRRDEKVASGDLFDLPEECGLRAPVSAEQVLDDPQIVELRRAIQRLEQRTHVARQPENTWSRPQVERPDPEGIPRHQQASKATVPHHDGEIAAQAAGKRIAPGQVSVGNSLFERCASREIERRVELFEVVDAAVDHGRDLFDRGTYAVRNDRVRPGGRARPVEPDVDGHASRAARSVYQ